MNSFIYEKMDKSCGWTFLKEDLIGLVNDTSDATLFGFCIFDDDSNTDIFNICEFTKPYDVLMIDFSNMNNRINVELFNDYMRVNGYGHMDIVYESRLVYVSKEFYKSKTGNTDDIVDEMSGKYIIKF